MLVVTELTVQVIKPAPHNLTGGDKAPLQRRRTVLAVQWTLRVFAQIGTQGRLHGGGSI